MIYRRTRAADRIQMKEILSGSLLQYDGREPLIGFVAEGDSPEDNGKLIGFSYVHKAAIIDPFVCESPVAAMKLFYQTEGALSALDYNNIVIQVSSTNRKLLDELPRLGFERVQNKFAIFKKVSR